MPHSFLVRLTPTQLGSDIFVATPINPNAHPEHPIVFPPEIWGPPGPWPTPPIHLPEGPDGELPPAKSRWEFNGGWYFVSGPYPRPRPLSGDNVALDPIKTGWKFLNGWYLVSGPYDKPFPIFGVDPPVDPEPPEQPPETDDCKWHYTSRGWVLICGPYDKPKPPG